MINPWILVIALLIVNFLWLAPALGVAGMPLTILLTVALIGLLALTKMGNVFKLARGQALAVLVVPLFIVALYSGWLAGYGFTPAALGLTPGAVVAPTAVAPTEAVAACKASVSDEIRGLAATLVVSAWNLESNTPYSLTVNLGTNCWVFTNGNEAINYAGATTATSGTSHTAYANVGDIVYVYCGGTVGYTEPIEAFCVEKVNQPIDLMTHGAVAVTSLQMSCFDNTGAVACSTADNTSIGNFDITLGTDSDDTFYYRLKVNVADNATNLGGFAIMVNNDIDDAYPIAGQGLTQVPVPKFLKGITVGCGSAQDGFNFTSASYDSVWTLPTPILLTEWQYRDYGFTIEAGTDPAATNKFSTSDSVIIMALDAQYARGSDGKVYLDVYAHTAGEENVGITEDGYGSGSAISAKSVATIYGI